MARPLWLMFGCDPAPRMHPKAPETWTRRCGRFDPEVDPPFLKTLLWGFHDFFWCFCASPKLSWAQSLEQSMQVEMVGPLGLVS